MNNIEYLNSINPLNFSYSFGYYLSALSLKGYIAYEYNPLLNYRLSLNLDSNGLHPGEAVLVLLNLKTKLRYTVESNLEESYLQFYTIDNKEVTITDSLRNRISSDTVSEEDVIVDGNLQHLTLYVYYLNDPNLKEAGSIVDLDTELFNFSLKNPVEIIAQPSYDGSVNLILNDNRNIPRLINTRFSPTGLNTYEIVDRIGNNDTNIYDDQLFDLDTALQKRFNVIPVIHYKGLLDHGNLKVGNYSVYLRYADADDNESDFIAESGIISVFRGSDKDPFSIDGGFAEMNAHKSIVLRVTNVDSEYDYIKVYYTRASSSIDELRTVTAFKIENKYLVKNRTCDIVITGDELTTTSTVPEINSQYALVDSVKSLDAAENMLFMANVHQPDIPAEDLKDISLRMLPYLVDWDKTDLIGNIGTGNYIDFNYKGEYYNTQNIYNNVGYWDESIYRFGVVYILSDSSLSPVFNIRGIHTLPTKNDLLSTYTTTSLRTLFDEENKRIYIKSDENTFILENSIKELENSKGVCGIDYKYADNDTKDKVLSIGLYIDNTILSYLKEVLKIKGLFLVRQKRMPTLLTQAFTLARDPLSGAPLVGTSNTTNPESNTYYGETFLTQNGRYLRNTLSDRLYKFENKFQENVHDVAAICPDFETNQPYYNTLFTGAGFIAREAKLQYSQINRFNSRFYGNTTDAYVLSSARDFITTKIVSVTDESPAVVIGDTVFRAKVGDATDIRLFKYYESENIRDSKATNLVRGSYNPYLGMVSDSALKPHTLLNIYILGYNPSYMADYFQIRYNDNSPFYAITNRIDLLNSEELIPTYLSSEEEGDNYEGVSLNAFRGDCFKCTFTHRINRNFLDPGAQCNDIIVDEATWANNYNVDDITSIDKINRGDVNAVQLGSWYTIKVNSSRNLSIRSLDASHITEFGLTGVARGFYPLQQLTVEGNYKIPSAYVYNDGFSSTVNERMYTQMPDTTYIKNFFKNRIMYSDVSQNEAKKNGYRVFKSLSYTDYNREYGLITKILEFGGNLLCVFEHGIAAVPVNEKALVSEAAGVYINSERVLSQKLTVITNTYGSLWSDSVIKTDKGIYGVDTIAKTIWMIAGTNSPMILSDLKVRKFLLENISLSEREFETVIGIRNVKTHYNREKGDVMFTFYDNTYGFEEKAWNLCWNENQSSFTTFYSWIPSSSENIDTLYFSYDRMTAKYIAKLAACLVNSTSADGVQLNSTVLKTKDDEYLTSIPGYNLGLAGRPLPKDPHYYITYKLEVDNFRNYLLFDLQAVLKLSGDLEERVPTDSAKIKNNYQNIDRWELIFKGGEYEGIYYPGTKEGFNSYLTVRNIPVALLNISASIEVMNTGDDKASESYLEAFSDFVTTNSGQYLSQIAVTSEEILTNPMLTDDDKKLPSLTTDLWKHGTSGIFDIKEDILPTHWYGKFHPFEFEVVVKADDSAHKIFENLLLLANEAEPESFHFEIVGDCYDFSPDIKNAYYRLEATKELYLNLGSNIIYNHDYTDTVPMLNPISVIFPLYYNRIDTFDEIYHSYQLMKGKGKNYQNLSGTEVYRDDLLDHLYRLITHIKNSPINGYWKRVSEEEFKLSTNRRKLYRNTCYYLWEKGSRLRGNSHYREDKWYILIPSLTYMIKNEYNNRTIDDEHSLWIIPKNSSIKLPPLILNGIPNDIIHTTITQEALPNTYDNMGSISTETWTNRRETRLRGKYIKIRIRYSGELLALIYAMYTIMGNSHS